MVNLVDVRLDLLFMFSLQQFYYDASRYNFVLVWRSQILNLKTHVCYQIWKVLDHNFFRYFSSSISFFSASETPVNTYSKPFVAVPQISLRLFFSSRSFSCLFFRWDNSYLSILKFRLFPLPVSFCF